MIKQVLLHLSKNIDLLITDGEKQLFLDCANRALGVLSYIILVGYPPFYDTAPLRLKTKILRGKYEFHPQFWVNVSEEAKDFIQKLLTVDMRTRMTAAEALQHPWVRHSLHCHVMPCYALNLMLLCRRDCHCLLLKYTLLLYILSCTSYMITADTISGKKKCSTNRSHAYLCMSCL